MTADQLREIPILAGVDDEQLARLVGAGRERRLAPGELLFRQGDRASFFHIVLEGRLETTRDVAGEQVLMMSHDPGGYLGAMALLTDTPYRGSTTSVADTLVFELDGEELRRLAFAHPPLLRAFLPTLEAVSGTVKEVEGDRERLLAIGRIAAGLAHELNNPAAAAARGVATLRDLERQRQGAFAEVASGGAPAERLAALAALGVEAADRTVPAGQVDPLAESDRELELLEALEERGLPGAAEIGSLLTEAGLGPEWVDRVAETIGDGHLVAGLRFVAACAGARVLLAELDEATARIASLVDAVRSYSFLDRAPRQAVDIHQGLENTLSLLGHELREKRVAIGRDFDPELPAVEASGSELNQVWTNLIENALDAVGPEGRITLRTSRQGGRVCVEIGDDGPGIPEELQARVFEPFFTTKPVGQGTGLGLDIARRLVVRHHGELRLRSRPGDTRVQVLIPVR
jgi:signal transduction histidine kinase